MTRISETPSSTRRRAVSSAVSPAPIEEDPASCQRLEDAPRRGGARCRRRTSAAWPSAVSVRTRLPHSSADHEEPVRHGAGRARLGREAVRLADLPEDLRLAEDHRVEARGDAEEVPHRRVAAAREGRLPEERVVHAVEAREEPRERVEAVLAVRQAVDLGAVARGDDRALGQDVLREEPARSASRAFSGVKASPLSQVERRRPVVPADEDEVHAGEDVQPADEEVDGGVGEEDEDEAGDREARRRDGRRAALRADEDEEVEDERRDARTRSSGRAPTAECSARSRRATPRRSRGESPTDERHDADAERRARSPARGTTRRREARRRARQRLRRAALQRAPDRRGRAARGRRPPRTRRTRAC